VLTSERYVQTAYSNLEIRTRIYCKSMSVGHVEIVIENHVC